MKKILLLVLLSTFIFSNEVSLEDFIDTNDCQVVEKSTYSVCYSYKYKSALSGWTKIIGELAIKEGIKERLRFHEEPKIPKQYRTKYGDYTGYGKSWNRSHFVVSDAESDYSWESLNESYSMVNIVPMSSLVNQKTWTKVERYGRLIASQLGYLNSISIAKYENSNIKFNGITVPTDFYRIYYNNDEKFLKCFHYENKLDIDYKNDKLKDHEIDCNILLKKDI